MNHNHHCMPHNGKRYLLVFLAKPDYRCVLLYEFAPLADHKHSRLFLIQLRAFSKFALSSSSRGFVTKPPALFASYSHQNDIVCASRRIKYDNS